MSYQREREDFLLWAVRNGIGPFTARMVLRYAATLQRLAVAQCNGDYPADNGQRTVTVCPQCEALWAPEVLKGPDKLCPDCRTTALAQKAIAGTGWIVQVGGDPRGYVMKLYPENSLEADRQSGRVDGRGVPAKE